MWQQLQELAKRVGTMETAVARIDTRLAIHEETCDDRSARLDLLLRERGERLDSLLGTIKTDLKDHRATVESLVKGTAAWREQRDQHVINGLGAAIIALTVAL